MQIVFTVEKNMEDKENVRTVDFFLSLLSIWKSLIWLVIEIWWRMVCDTVDKNVLHNSNMNIPTFFDIFVKATLDEFTLVLI